MKKLLIFLLASGAAIGSFYFYKNHMSPGGGINPIPIIGTGGSSNEALSYVPADTIIFAGGTQPFPLQKFFDSSIQYQSNTAMMAEDLPPDAEPGIKFVLALLEAYVGAVNTGSMDDFGLARENLSVFYTSGITPVLRLHLANADNFKRVVSTAEEKSGITPFNGELQGLAYQSYALSEESQFVIAYQGDYAVLTLKIGGLPAESFAQALGATKPSQSILDTELLSGTIQRYKFLPEILMFISFENLADYLTRPDNKEKASLIALLDETKQADFAFLNQPACRTEMKQFTQNWRGIFAGYTRLEFSGKRIEGTVEYHIEHNNATLGAALGDLRGFVLPSLRDLNAKRVLGLGLGFDTTKVFMSLSKIWEDISKANYQCEEMKRAHTALMQSNPAAMATMTGMLAGLKGANLDLKDLKLVQGGPVPGIESVELALTLSADDPKQLMAAATTMVPFLNGMPMPEQGQTVDVPFPIPMVNVPAKLSLFGKHIAITLGDKALEGVKNLGSVEPTANGLYLFNMNFSQLMNLIGPSLQQYAGLLEADPEELSNFIKAMQNYDGGIVGYFDFTKNSFVLGVDYIGENKQ